MILLNELDIENINKRDPYLFHDLAREINNVKDIKPKEYQLLRMVFAPKPEGYIVEKFTAAFRAYQRLPSTPTIKIETIIVPRLFMNFSVNNLAQQLIIERYKSRVEEILEV